MSEGEFPTMSGSRRRLPMQAASRLGDDIYHQIKKQILSVSIVKGTRLYETVVARKFGASRTPIREALMRLQEEGLLERQGRAYTVREISLTEMVGMYMVRKQLEILSVSIAAASISDAEIEALSRIIRSMDDALADRDKLSVNSFDSQFHMTIAEATGNKALVDILFGIHEKVRLVRNSLEEIAERFPSANEEHSLILSALRRRVPQVAVAEMDAHIQPSIDFLMQLSTPAMAADTRKSKR